MLTPGLLPPPPRGMPGAAAAAGGHEWGAHPAGGAARHGQVRGRPAHEQAHLGHLLRAPAHALLGAGGGWTCLCGEEQRHVLKRTRERPCSGAVGAVACAVLALLHGCSLRAHPTISDLASPPLTATMVAGAVWAAVHARPGGGPLRAADARLPARGRGGLHR